MDKHIADTDRECKQKKQATAAMASGKFRAGIADAMSRG